MYKNETHFHFVGIGGIGMSGLALILKQRGYTVSGCDQDLESVTIEHLAQAGCDVRHKNNSTFCTATDYSVLIYSTAISATSPEIVAAQARSIPVIHRSEVLKELMRFQFGIGVTGSHGKTTTSSLIAHILMSAQVEPTIVVGGIMHNINSNARLGRGQFIVAEADESDRSFLRLHPAIGVVTNIDLEHLETYKDIADIKHSFLTYINQIPFYGAAIINADDAYITDLLPHIKSRTISFGITNKADIKAEKIVLGTHSTTLTLHIDGQNHGLVEVPLAGIHNAGNALAAIAAAREAGISLEAIKEGIRTFSGVERRFTHKSTINGAEIYDDYGHHPKELDHTFTIAKKRATQKLIAVFQPHRYSRTACLWNEFITSFKQAPLDKLIITDIYAASEAPIEGISGQALVDALRAENIGYPIEFISSQDNFAGLIERIKTELLPGNLILLQGAGRLDKIPNLL